MTRPIFDLAGDRVRFLRGPPKARAKRTTPEDDLQKAVVDYLRWALPENVYHVRAGKEGAKRTGRDRTDFRAMGGAAGWPDLMIFNRQTRAYRWIELKAPKTASYRGGVTSGGQDEILVDLRDHARVCRSLEDVEQALLTWGVPLRVPLSQANRYQAGRIPEGQS